MLQKIISGGQTGVDRAALDTALKNHFPCGGYCPKNRLAEDGIIAARYPLKELPSSSYAKRTLENVLCSDGTLIIYSHELKGGTALTARLCEQQQKPYLLVDAEQYKSCTTTKNLLNFINKNEIQILNVAGPRKSQWPAGYEYTFQCLEEVIQYNTAHSLHLS